VGAAWSTVRYPFTGAWCGKSSGEICHGRLV
jgi:hypothetical protein